MEASYVPAPAHVLVVDDVPLNQVYMEKLLERPELKVATVGSGQEALDVCADEDFALILMDVQMPDMDGFEAAKLLRANVKTSRTPIIFVTAVSREQKYIFQGYKSGAVDYLLKPVDPVILRSKVDVFCELYIRTRQVEAQLEEIRAQKETLQRQLKEIDLLSGLIPICAACKKIRNDDGFWEGIEAYISTRSDAEFSHAICPECEKRLYGDL